jgi:integrase
MASLIQQDGRYYGQFFSRSKNPQRKRIPLGKNRRKAREKLSRLETSLASGAYDPWLDAPEAITASSVSTLAEAVARFIEARRGLRRATTDHYRWVLSTLVESAGPGLSVRALSAPRLSDWLSRDLSITSRHTYWTRARVFCRWLVSENMLSKDVTAGVIVASPPDKLASKLVTEAQMLRLVDLSRPAYVGDAVVLAYDLALRAREICEMRTSWIDVDRRLLTLIQDDLFTAKTGKQVVKPISSRAFDRITPRLGAPDDRLFTNTRGQPLDPKHLSHTFKKVVRRAGMSEHITLHGLRHGGLSHAANNGASVEGIRLFAGHTTTAMTMRYIHLLPNQYEEQLRAAFEQNLPSVDT